eukprot:TRINITY_DN8572_c0_g1_i1.p1 TRINITY_DN8572_c0_g1~~TRINITY_DN8572_c0_g1_i1.p1  ORF type:complete len:962 (+),score=230.06 TRINITY_DN8572_c0_g1_i1:57-2942(+)
MPPTTPTPPPPPSLSAAADLLRFGAAQSLLRWKIHVHASLLTSLSTTPSTTPSTTQQHTHESSDTVHFLVTIAPTARVKDLLSVATATFHTLYTQRDPISDAAPTIGKMIFTHARHASGADLNPKETVCDVLDYRDHILVSCVAGSFPSLPTLSIPAPLYACQTERHEKALQSEAVASQSSSSSLSSSSSSPSLSSSFSLPAPSELDTLQGKLFSSVHTLYDFLLSHFARTLSSMHHVTVNDSNHQESSAVEVKNESMDQTLCQDTPQLQSNQDDMKENTCEALHDGPTDAAFSIAPVLPPMPCGPPSGTASHECDYFFDPAHTIEEDPIEISLQSSASCEADQACYDDESDDPSILSGVSTQGSFKLHDQEISTPHQTDGLSATNIVHESADDDPKYDLTEQTHYSLQSNTIDSLQDTQLSSTTLNSQAQGPISGENNTTNIMMETTSSFKTDLKEEHPSHLPQCPLPSPSPHPLVQDSTLDQELPTPKDSTADANPLQRPNEAEIAAQSHAVPMAFTTPTRRPSWRKLSQTQERRPQTRYANMGSKYGTPTSASQTLADQLNSSFEVSKNSDQANTPRKRGRSVGPSPRNSRAAESPSGPKIWSFHASRVYESLPTLEDDYNLSAQGLPIISQDLNSESPATITMRSIFFDVSPPPTKAPKPTAQKHAPATASLATESILNLPSLGIQASPTGSDQISSFLVADTGSLDSPIQEPFSPVPENATADLESSATGGIQSEVSKNDSKDQSQSQNISDRPKSSSRRSGSKIIEHDTLHPRVKKESKESATISSIFASNQQVGTMETSSNPTTTRSKSVKGSSSQNTNKASKMNTSSIMETSLPSKANSRTSSTLFSSSTQRESPKQPHDKRNDDYPSPQIKVALHEDESQDAVPPSTPLSKQVDSLHTPQHGKDDSSSEMEDTFGFPDDKKAETLFDAISKKGIMLTPASKLGKVKRTWARK